MMYDSEMVEEAGRAWVLAYRYSQIVSRDYEGPPPGGFLVAMVKGQALVLPDAYCVRKARGCVAPTLKLKAQVLAACLSFSDAHAFLSGFKVGLSFRG